MSDNSIYIHPITVKEREQLNTLLSRYSDYLSSNSVKGKISLSTFDKLMQAVHWIQADLKTDIIEK